jgi:hypothetical protein
MLSQHYQDYDFALYVLIQVSDKDISEKESNALHVL